MNRTSLATAVIAGMAGCVGIGNLDSCHFARAAENVLIYPYYTVNVGREVNSIMPFTRVEKPKPKTIRVRFVE